MAISITTLSFGAILSVPAVANAGLLSSFLFGEEAQADSIDTLTRADDGANSQTIALLEAGVSSTLLNKNSNKKNEEEIDEDIELNITDNALVPSVSSLGVKSGTQLSDAHDNDQVSIYVVKKGDTVSELARMFDVSVNTIYWANDLKKGESLKVGSTIVILPFDGLTHTVAPKETLAGIAKFYKADIEDIRAFNGLSKDSKLAVGDELVIPNGEKIELTPPTKSSSSPKSSGLSPSSLKSVPGYFINPLPTGPRIRKTQGLHNKYAIDIGAPVGTPIYAAASGTVALAKTGYNGGYGTLVIIKHSNGTETRYAHMSRLGTSGGKYVTQGEVIGYVGSTGRSTGPHLHYEVRGARNNLQ